MACIRRCGIHRRDQSRHGRDHRRSECRRGRGRRSGGDCGQNGPGGLGVDAPVGEIGPAGTHQCRHRGSRRGTCGPDHLRNGVSDQLLPSRPDRSAHGRYRGDPRCGKGDGGASYRTLLGPERPDRRGGRDHALELPAASDHRQGRTGPGGRMHRGAQALGSHAAGRRASGADHP
ncbi:hypothetical protein D3C81_1662760 [compost metagenome]